VVSLENKNKQMRKNPMDSTNGHKTNGDENLKSLPVICRNQTLQIVNFSQEQ
jgi:hypothetical protein